MLLSPFSIAFCSKVAKASLSGWQKESDREPILSSQFLRLGSAALYSFQDLRSVLLQLLALNMNYFSLSVCRVCVCRQRSIFLLPPEAERCVLLKYSSERPSLSLVPLLPCLKSSLYKTSLVVCGTS